jgi:hypothetical protein
VLRAPSSPAARRGLRWAVVVALATLVLAALAVRGAAVGALGAGKSLDAVRLLAAAFAAGGAVVAARRASRSEAVGLGVAAGALALCVLGDVLARAALEGRPATDARVAVVHGGWAVLAFGVPAAAGAVLLRIHPLDLLAAPARPLGPLVAAAVGGLLLYPALGILQGGADALAAAVLGPSPGGTSLGWPGVRVAAMKESFPASSANVPLRVFLDVALQLPLLELLTHGVLRQAFLRWGARPFVVVTAALAGVLRVRGNVDFFAFGGSLLTGWIAARSGSVVPGIVFWIALFAGWVFWGSLIPPS